MGFGDKEKEDLLAMQTAALTGLISTLTTRAFDATERAGKAEGYGQRLKEELTRQLEVQSQMASKVAWYENITRIVVGGQVSSDANGPHATGIRCERCHRQVEEHGIVAHLLKHTEDDAKELEIKRRADQIRAEAEGPDDDDDDDDKPKPKPKPKKRAPRKK